MNIWRIKQITVTSGLNRSGHIAGCVGGQHSNKSETLPLQLRHNRSTAVTDLTPPCHSLDRVYMTIRLAFLWPSSEDARSAGLSQPRGTQCLHFADNVPYNYKKNTILSLALPWNSQKIPLINRWVYFERAFKSHICYFRILAPFGSNGSVARAWSSHKLTNCQLYSICLILYLISLGLWISSNW